MIKAVLLDLDNTLVLYDEPAYYRRYFKALAPHFEDLLSREELVQRLLKATAALQKNQGQRTNLPFFLDAFIDGLPILPKELWLRFEGFYANHYGHFGEAVAPVDGLQRVLGELKRAGLTMVVATNPMFPLLALEKRLAWVGLQAADFSLITHMENMRFVKPNPGYYEQICTLLGHPPQACLMVGNDLTNDMAAGLAGLATYHTTDIGRIDYASMRSANPTGHTQQRVPDPDYSGPFRDLGKVIGKLI